MKRSRKSSPHKVPEAAEACGRRGRQAPYLTGLLDHSILEFVFYTKNHWRALSRGMTFYYVLERSLWLLARDD